MKLIFEYIKKYKKTYIAVVIIFIVGMIIGVVINFKTSEEEKLEIRDYITSSIENIQNNKENKQTIFFEYFMQNLKFALLVWILGCTVIAGFTIYILMIYKGFLLGYIISIIINIFGIKQGLNYLALLILVQNIFLLPAIFLLATSGIRLYKGIINKQVELKYELIRHTVILVITAGIIIISSCLETYVLNCC